MRRLVLAAMTALFGAVLTIASASAAGASGSWHEAGTMAVEHNGHSATLLNDGSVLVAGGGGEDTSIASAELYDPGANSWRPLASLTAPRQGHAAVRLDDGRVLVVGGLEMERPGAPGPAGERGSSTLTPRAGPERGSARWPWPGSSRP